MKSAFKIILILAVIAFVIVSVVSIDDKSEDTKCTGMELNINDSLSMGMIGKEDIAKIIDNKKISVEGKKISELNLGNIERILSENPYIDTATCALTSSGVVKINVVPRIPVLHVITNNGEEYYLDRRGISMPLSDNIENLCIATGKISKDFAKQKLAPMACCIQDNEFWRAQIQQIEVRGEYDILVYTRFSDHVVQFGKAENVADKLWRLKAFYDNALSVVGWNKYETINVGYDGIVIGEKKNKN